MSGSPAGTTSTARWTPGIRAPISNWGWPGGFGANGIDAALWSGTKCYFFSGSEYIRVTRGDTSAGTVDAGYPRPISVWGWPGGFGANGIDAALYSGSRCYFFSGSEYVRVRRGEEGAGLVNARLSEADRGQLGLDGRVRRQRHRRRPLQRRPAACRLPRAAR